MIQRGARRNKGHDRRRTQIMLKKRWSKCSKASYNRYRQRKGLRPLNSKVKYARI